MKEIAGKTAVVTGGGSGIGRSISLALANAGANVVIADIEEEAAKAVAEEVMACGVGSFGMQVDVSKLEDVKALSEAVYDKFKSVEILCNNAGVTLRPYRNHWDYSYEEWKWVMDINFWGVQHGHMVFVPNMLKTPGEKHIVNTSSVVTLYTNVKHAAYSSTKAAIDGLSQCAREELKPYDIGVSLLHPGKIRTRLVTSDRLRFNDQKDAQYNVDLWSDGFSNYDPDKSKTFSTSDIKKIVEMGIDPDIASTPYEYIQPTNVGTYVVEGILKNKAHIVTHPLPIDRIKSRFDGILAAEPTYPIK
ncbi:SDR family NAD(P)-dependent oxidoreductase [Neobacillus sp. YX16]|uniref:SDR family NAD(P)-dependent oxidoreductase n=1 Tax=Neobacillus sp. YX16 TaxID=3047874 RepID=UPI0024C2BD19|nr:SDR family NAD(P)-dependent oxidoreductase [Neobacillus sp. YX16]WHZ00876.1 SDR family NAD(P)-dependent oxidoreductase [Neobacillus sp. YX16]